MKYIYAEWICILIVIEIEQKCSRLVEIYTSIIVKTGQNLKR